MLKNHITLPSNTSSPIYQYKKQRIPFPDDMPSFQKQHQESSHEKAFLIISIIIFICGFISGIVCGNVFHTTAPNIVTSYLDGTGNFATIPGATSFNIKIMFLIWLSTAILGLLFLAISFHFKNQKRIIERLDSIISK